MQAEDLRYERRKNRALAALSIVAAACVVLGSSHMVGEAAPSGAPAACDPIGVTNAAPDAGEVLQ